MSSVRTRCARKRLKGFVASRAAAYTAIRRQPKIRHARNAESAISARLKKSGRMTAHSCFDQTPASRMSGSVILKPWVNTMKDPSRPANSRCDTASAAGKSGARIWSGSS